MKTTLKSILGSIIFAVLLSGCATSFLSLEHNKETRTTIINFADKSYVLTDSEELRKDKSSGNILLNNAQVATQSYISNDEDCKNIQYRETQNLDNSRRYYNTSSKEDTYRNNGNNCTTEKINRVEFHECEYRNVITRDINGQYGISQKKYIIIKNKQCFYKLRDFVKGEKTVYEQKKYAGTFTAETNQDKCGSGGELSVFISSNNKINGSASYEYKGKNISTKLWGEVKDNQFHGETRNVKFYGDISANKNLIEGEYFNRSCKGTFTLKKL